MAARASLLQNDLGMRWLERVRGAAGPIYLALADALEAAVRGGELQPGDRLPPQRAVAEALGVDFTTVTRSRTLPHQVTARAELSAVVAELTATVLPLRKPVRLLGVSVSNFDTPASQTGPQMMFAF